MCFILNGCPLVQLQGSYSFPKTRSSVSERNSSRPTFLSETLQKRSGSLSRRLAFHIGCRRSRCHLHRWLFRGVDIAIRPRRHRSLVLARGWNLHLLPQSVFQLLANVLVLLQEHARILAALPHALAAKAQPRAGLLDHALLDANVQQIAFAGYPFTVQNVEFCLTERRRHLILYNLRPCS